MSDRPIVWWSTGNGLGRPLAEARGLPEGEEQEEEEDRRQCLGRAWPGEEKAMEREEKEEKGGGAI